MKELTTQGVAEVMELVSQYWAFAYAEGAEKRKHDTPAGDAQRVLAKLQQAITAIVRERDSLKARVAVLEKNAARWRFWSAWWMRSGEDAGQLPELVLALMDELDLDEAIDAAIAARKETS